MKIGMFFLFALCGMASQRLIAQDRGESCGLNDSECLEVEAMGQCGDPSTSTVQSCSTWIRSIQDRAGTSDTVAIRHLAEAHSAISQNPATSAEERLFHRGAAREIYASLIEQDERDVRALRGMAALSRNLSERIDVLRKIVAIIPQAFDAELLAEALAQRDGDGDLLEAAQVLDRSYRMLPKGVGWDLGAQAVAFYELAGTPERGRYIKERVRDELDETSFLSELRSVPATTSSRVGEILSRLCDKSAVYLLGESSCINGLQEMSKALAGSSDLANAQDYAEVVVRQIQSHTALGRAQMTGNPGWQRAVESLFLEIDAANIESPLILIARSRLSERDPMQRLRLLERASRLIPPDDGRMLQRLADEYMVLRRRSEALEILRRIRQLPTTTESHRRIIDLNIASLEGAERASRGAGSER